MALDIFPCGRRWFSLVAMVVAGLSDPASSADSAIAAEASWLDLFTFPEVWGIVGAKFLSYVAWYFYLFWVPKYLYDARGFDVKKVGYFAWIPYRGRRWMSCWEGGFRAG